MDVQAPTAPGWHARPVDDLASDLRADLGRGLEETEAADRLQRYGPNLITEQHGPTRLRLFLEQFNNVLIWILIAAAVISGALLGEWIDAVVIMAIVVMNAVLGYVQESRAEDALAALKDLAAPEAVVVRGGTEVRVLNRDVVPGDLLVLHAGDRVAADARVVEAIHLEADESALTGESLPVAKRTTPVREDVALADRVSLVFAGTVVAAGRGRAVVVATGPDTEVGQLAAVLAADEPPTPLQVELARVGKRLAVLALATAAIVFVAGFARGFAAEEMLLVSVALAVAAIPEGLPAVVTITLARGVQRMSERRAIVRRLPAVEALGSATVICSDKTGTITRNELHVQELVPAGRTVDLVDPADPVSARYVQVATLCNDARRGAGGYLGDPTEVALLRSVEGGGLDPGDVRATAPRLDEIAFDSRRKLMSTLHRTAGGLLLAVKGAPEVVLARTATIETGTGPGPLDEQGRHDLSEAAAGLAARGLRTLALAYRMLPEVDLDDPGFDLEDYEHDLTVVAVAGMSDEPRPEVPAAVATAGRAGIRPVMVTGDHQVTAEAVGKEVGILTAGGKVMGGRRLSETTVEELTAGVTDYSVYARVDPLDKVKIVKAWQAHGGIVAMTGDGVNDAPALRAADIGVAMGSGTQVAKDASAMVLADDNFATIVEAVREGRGIFANLKKVVYFLLSCNISEVLVMLAGFLFFAGLGEPLLPVQLLWINLVTDGLPAVALGMDPVAASIMDRPPDRQRNILARSRQLRLLWQGTVLTVATVSVIVAGHYWLGYEWVTVRTMSFTTLVLVQLAHAFNVRAQGTTASRAGFTSNPTLLAATGGSLVLHLLVIYTPFGHTFFDTTGLPLVAWLPVLGATAASFLIVDLIKRLAFRRGSDGAGVF